jgi:hypothetical protein
VKGDLAGTKVPSRYVSLCTASPMRLETLTELGAVLGVDTTTVDDPGGICDFLRYGLGEPLSDIVVSLLGLLNSCDFAGSDSPDGFVWMSAKSTGDD